MVRSIQQPGEENKTGYGRGEAFDGFISLESLDSSIAITISGRSDCNECLAPTCASIPHPRFASAFSKFFARGKYRARNHADAVSDWTR